MLTNLSIIIGIILSLGAVFQLVTNMLLATPVEYHLESNYQRIFRYAVHVTTVSFFLMFLLLFGFLNSKEGAKFKDIEINNPYFTGGYLLFLLVALGICIYVPFRDIWKENYQRKLIFKKDNGKKYIILKKFLNNKVLLTPVETTKNIQYCIIKEDDLEKGLLELESYQEVRERRAIKYYTSWNNFSRCKKRLNIISLIIIAGLVAFFFYQSNIQIINPFIGDSFIGAIIEDIIYAIILVALCMTPYVLDYRNGKELTKTK